LSRDLLFGTFSATQAGKKNRSAFGWFLCGFFFDSIELEPAQVEDFQAAKAKLLNWG